MQDTLLAKTEENSSRAVDNGLGCARRSGGVVDDARVLEVDALDGRSSCAGSRLEEVLETLCPLNLGCVVGLSVEALDGDDALEILAILHSSGHTGNLLAEIDNLAIIQRAIIKEDKLFLLSCHVSLHVLFIAVFCLGQKVELTLG